MSEIEKVLFLIETHHKRHDHGISCACMDDYIRWFRNLFSARDQKCQGRINYVLRRALRDLEDGIGLRTDDGNREGMM